MNQGTINFILQQMTGCLNNSQMMRLQNNPDALVLLPFPFEICYDTGVKCKGYKVCRHFTGGFFRWIKH